MILHWILTSCRSKYILSWLYDITYFVLYCEYIFSFCLYFSYTSRHTQSQTCFLFYLFNVLNVCLLSSVSHRYLFFLFLYSFLSLSHINSSINSSIYIWFNFIVNANGNLSLYSNFHMLSFLFLLLLLPSTLSWARGMERAPHGVGWDPEP